MLGPEILETETLDVGQDGTALTTLITMPVKDRSRSNSESCGWQVQDGQPSGRRRKGAVGSGLGREGERGGCRSKWAPPAKAINFVSACLGSGSSTAGLRFQSGSDPCEFPIRYIVPPGQTPHTAC